MRKPRLAHKHVDDRFRAPLRFRPELLIALTKRAMYLSALRRRKAGKRPTRRVLDVADNGQIWLQKPQGYVLQLYRDQAEYLRKQTGHANVPPISVRTLERNVRLLRDRKLIQVDNPSRYDKRRGAWVQQHNIYIINRAALLWINANARSIKIPLVV